MTPLTWVFLAAAVSCESEAPSVAKVACVMHGIDVSGMHAVSRGRHMAEAATSYGVPSSLRFQHCSGEEKKRRNFSVAIHQVAGTGRGIVV